MGSLHSLPEGPTEELVSGSPPICFSGDQYCAGQPDTLFLRKDYDYSGLRRAFGHWKIVAEDPNGETLFKITMEKEEGLFGRRVVYIRNPEDKPILNLRLPKGMESVLQIRREGQEEVEGAVLVRKPGFAIQPDVKAYLPGSHKAGKCGNRPDIRVSENKWGGMVYTMAGEEKVAIAQLVYGKKDDGILWLADGADVALVLAIAAATDCLNDAGLLYRPTKHAAHGASGAAVAAC